MHAYLFRSYAQKYFDWNGAMNTSSLSECLWQWWWIHSIYIYFRSKPICSTSLKTKCIPWKKVIILTLCKFRIFLSFTEMWSRSFCCINEWCNWFQWYFMYKKELEASWEWPTQWIDDFILHYTFSLLIFVIYMSLQYFCPHSSQWIWIRKKKSTRILLNYEASSCRYSMNHVILLQIV